ncbi:hypothetical protein KAR91_43430 [Candidatus Pacearchaeota archaeon]|nr:hypothetical protein [Candidatus Pacearchaeota archaeon]
MKNPAENHTEITIGMFGTCDNILWRESTFIPVYNDKGIKYYNPVLENWSELLEMSRKGLCPNPTEEENYYLNNAEIILFPVLEYSLGIGSLAEMGFSVQRVIRNIMSGKPQFLITLIDDDCTDQRKTEAERDDSIKNRALVKSKILENVSYPVITIVQTLDEMLQMSLTAYELIHAGEQLVSDFQNKRA